MYNNSQIGFFDSGVGGLSVLSRFRKILPNEKTVYFGDLKNLPYGDKSQEELISYARRILKFFEAKRVKAVVIACNTSSAMAYETIKDEFDFKIYPIIQSCAKVLASMGLERIGVFATLGTINSNAYKLEINKYAPNTKVYQIACPNWVGIVEGVSSVDAELDIKLHVEDMLKNSPQKIILGCTHYPYLLKELSQYAKSDIFLDPAEIFVDFIKKDLKENGLLASVTNSGSEEFFVSANPKSFVENAKLFYEINAEPTIF